jgi:hypothetical protein
MQQSRAREQAAEYAPGFATNYARAGSTVLCLQFRSNKAMKEKTGARRNRVYCGKAAFESTATRLRSTKRCSAAIESFYIYREIWRVSIWEFRILARWGEKVGLLIMDRR